MFVSTVAQGEPVHSGSAAADLAFADSAISQGLTTTANHSYTISFWLWRGTGTTDGTFYTFFGGTQVAAISTQTNGQGWLQYTKTGDSTGTSTTLLFDNPGNWYLDDVSVTDNGATGNGGGDQLVPEASSLLMLSSGTAPLGMLLGYRRFRCKT